jgi:hypothetical protein
MKRASAEVILAAKQDPAVGDTDREQISAEARAEPVHEGLVEDLLARVVAAADREEAEILELLLAHLDVDRGEVRQARGVGGLEPARVLLVGHRVRQIGAGDHLRDGRRVWAVRVVPLEQASIGRQSGHAPAGGLQDHHRAARIALAAILEDQQQFRDALRVSALEEALRFAEDVEGASGGVGGDEDEGQGGQIHLVEAPGAAGPPPQDLARDCGEFQEAAPVRDLVGFAIRARAEEFLLEAGEQRFIERGVEASADPFRERGERPIGQLGGGARARRRVERDLYMRNVERAFCGGDRV